VKRPQRKTFLQRAVMPLQLVFGDPLALTGLVILLAVIAMAAFAPFIATHDPHLIIEEEEGSIMELAGGQWRIRASLGSLALSGLDSISGRTLAVGRLGSVYEQTDGRWAQLDSPLETDLNHVALNPVDGTALLVGDRGVIALLDSSGNWELIEAPESSHLFGAAWLSADQALLVGAAETVWLLDRDSDAALLTPLTSPVGRGMNLRAVAADGDFTPGGALIVGDRGILLQLVDGELQLQRLPSTRDLNGVHVAAGGNALIVGERGTLLRRIDGSWTEDISPDSRALRGGVIRPDGSAIAVGRNGVVLAIAPEAPEGWLRMETGTERHFRAIALLDGQPVAVGSDPFVNKLAPPSVRHWFGTDHLGRDLFSQNVYGSRIALLVGFLGALLVVLIGTNVGLFAGYYRGRTDSILMRIVDVVYGVPFEPFAMILVLLFDPSLTIVIVAVSLLTWRTVARLIRSQVLSLSERPFVKAARVAGASDLRILYLHIAPNILPLVLLQLAIIVGSSIIAEATLSFLGLGPPKSISWGGILHNARLSGAWRTAWWWNLPPGIFIMLTVLGVFFISRSLEVIANPRLRSR
jgi:ABC-type dipeptide/oligopeptide/nickel transport system permease subunit